MMHDPFQSYSALGGYSQVASPFGVPYTAQASAINPAALLNPLAAVTGGVQAFGQPGNPGIQQPYALGNPQQQQIAQALAAQAIIAQSFGLSPFTAGLQNPLTAVLQNPLVQNQLLQNQLAAQAWQHPQTLQPQIGYGGSPYGQSQYSVSPYGQIGYGQLGAQLAPQTWVGQGVGQGVGQINPLLHQLLNARAFQTPGIPQQAWF